MPNAPTKKKSNYKVVYTIVERRRDGRKFWLRIGAAFENHDGSLNVHLDAMPTNGQLQIRELRSFDESRSRVTPLTAANDMDASDGERRAS